MANNISKLLPNFISVITAFKSAYFRTKRSTNRDTFDSSIGSTF